MPFADQIAAGINLIRQALRSPNYVPGVSGWTINKDGSAEFSNSVIRGLLEVVGLNGGIIEIIPDGGNSGDIPTIKILSPDGTNFAFINVTSPTNSQAQLGINSGKFTPSDGVQRYWRILAADDNIVNQVIRASDQSSFGGYIQESHIGSVIGYRNPSGDFTLMNFTNGEVTLQDSPSNSGIIAPIPRGALVNRKDNVSQPTTATEALDGGIGSANTGYGVSNNTAFTAISGHSYRVRYRARIQCQTASTAADLRIRDGGSSPATTASPIIAATSIYMAITGGPGAFVATAEATLDCPGDIAVGDHTLGGFYVRTAGGSTILVDQSGGMKRELTVEDLGGTP